MNEKYFLFVIFNLLLYKHYIRCSEPPNLEELEDSENWVEISDEICKNTHSIDIQNQIEKCNELDPYYRFDSLTKQCEKLRAHSGSNYYDEVKGDCEYQQCFDKLSKSTEFNKLSKYVDGLSEETKINKGHEKYNCIRNVLGLKI